MEKKINIAELLKDCPNGMELNCTSYDNVSFDKISTDKKAAYPIFCYITDEKGNRSSISFTEDGCESKRYGAKCVIFPKGKNTWEGFQRPFKDGDIISDNHFNAICIFKGEGNIKGTVDFYCGVSGISKICGGDEFFIKDNKNQNWHFGDIDGYSFATKEEKERLFQTIKYNGYKWDEKTKTLEKLIKPKFRVGDKIVNDDYVVEIIDMDIEGEVYGYKSKMGGIGGILFTEQDDWELVPDKFDFTTLKPFDKVLVRDSIFGRWKIEFFEKFDKGLKFPFICMNGKYSICIPYNGNEYLHDTINPCSDYYQI